MSRLLSSAGSWLHVDPFLLQNKRDKLDPDKAQTALDVQRQLAAQTAQHRDGGGGEAAAAEQDAAPAAVDSPGSSKPGLRLNLTGARHDVSM